jgi:hypothetical protein
LFLRLLCLQIINDSSARVLVDDRTGSKAKNGHCKTSLLNASTQQFAHGPTPNRKPPHETL